MDEIKALKRIEDRFDVAYLTPAHWRALVDFAVFLLWTKRSFRDTYEIFFTIPTTGAPPSGFLRKIYLSWRIVLGGWINIRRHGFGDTWLLIALRRGSIPNQI